MKIVAAVVMEENSGTILMNVITTVNKQEAMRKHGFLL